MSVYTDLVREEEYKECIYRSGQGGGIYGVYIQI